MFSFVSPFPKMSPPSIFSRKLTAKPSCCCVVTWWWSTWAWSSGPPSNSPSTLTSWSGLEAVTQTGRSLPKDETPTPISVFSDEYFSHCIWDKLSPLTCSSFTRSLYLEWQTLLFLLQWGMFILCSTIQPWGSMVYVGLSDGRSSVLHFSITWGVICGHLNCKRALLACFLLCYIYTVHFIFCISWIYGLVFFVFLNNLCGEMLKVRKP